MAHFATASSACPGNALKLRIAELSTSHLIRRGPIAAPGVQIPPKAFGVSRNRQIVHSAIIFEVDP